MPLIDEAYAWAVVQDARHGLVARAETAGLTIIGDGTWQCRCDARLTEAGAAQLAALLPVAGAGSPHVVAQIGQSLDGRIATASGHSHYVTGEASRVHLHRLRALVDAVVVGVGTVEFDDPQLTVRHVTGAHPRRVVLDPRGRVARDRTLFSGAGPETFHLVGPEAPGAPGAHRVPVPVEAGGRFAPAAVLAVLAERGMARVLVEGGGLTISSFLAAGCLDRVHCVVAPMLIGSGRPALALPEIATLHDAWRPACRDHPLGADRLYDLDLRAPGRA
ncbi:RibD family protein [Salinisphaera sp. Q1T1-3]|nr:RibD family protein [Salinisphaera sp. Q1T1-3]